MITVRRPSTRGDRVIASIEAPFGNFDVWFRSGDVSLVPAAEAWASAALPMAMFHGEPLRCEGELSPQWYRGQEAIQRVLAAWYPHLRRVPIECAGCATALHASDGSNAVAFFSGGVDSFSTALRRKEHLSALLLVHGFDIPLASADLWDLTRRRMTIAAAGLGLPLMTLTTNVRSFLEPMGRWGEIAHGAALASVALVLDHSVGTVYIPSSHVYTELVPWGSHPLVDPLWSTEWRLIRQDGAEFTRLEKTGQLAESAIALEHLRVCWQGGEQYNCGRCEKCIRTQCALVLRGVRDDITFPRSVTAARVRNVRIDDDSAASFARELADVDSTHPIAVALRHALWRRECRQQLRELGSLVWSSPRYATRWALDKLFQQRH